MTDANLQSLLSDRQRQWEQMAAAQRMTRIQRALLGTLDLARWRRMEARRRRAQRLAAQPKRIQRYDPL